uniref:Phytanoyl-CoA dioxygenase domain-containing protein 1 n=1 Tax=Acrobeloides nanus TaxID=290746 RepID=A0A914CGF3_9BILA
MNGLSGDGNIARQLEMKQPQVVQSMYIFKQPNIGDEVCEHVDSTYLLMEPTNKLLGVWIAIDEATLENGCLWFIPGSHKNNELNYRFIRSNSTDPNEPLMIYIGEKPVYDAEKYIPVPVPRGSLVLINGLVVHKSEKNLSNLSRHAYTFHIADKYESVWSPLNWPQETPTYKFPDLYE